MDPGVGQLQVQKTFFLESPISLCYDKGLLSPRQIIIAHRAFKPTFVFKAPKAFGSQSIFLNGCEISEEPSHPATACQAPKAKEG